MRVIGFLLPILAGTVGAAAASLEQLAQNAEAPMLVRSIAGRSFERLAYDPSGTVSGRSIIRVGELREVAGGVEVPVEITTYDERGEVGTRLSSVWTCRRGGEEMVMPLLFLEAAGNGGSERRLVVRGDPVLYPSDPPAVLPDLRLEIAIERGLVSFFGGRSVVLVTDRKVVVDASSVGVGAPGYTVTAAVTVKAFVVGVRVLRRRLVSTEHVIPGTGLVGQVLELADGSRSVIRAMDGEVEEGESPEPGAAGREPAGLWVSRSTEARGRRATLAGLCLLAMEFLAGRPSLARGSAHPTEWGPDARPGGKSSRVRMLA